VRTQRQVSTCFLASALVFATSEAGDAGDPNTVVTVGPGALLFFWRWYADPAPRAGRGPRFDLARGISAETLTSLLLARSTSRGIPLDFVRTRAGRGPATCHVGN